MKKKLNIKKAIKKPGDNIKKTKKKIRSFMTKDPKVSKFLAADLNKDGYARGGKQIQATDPFTSQTVTVRGTKRMRPDKKPVKATWY